MTRLSPTGLPRRYVGVPLQAAIDAGGPPLTNIYAEMLSEANMQLKRHTDELAVPDQKRLTSARCPICCVDRPTFHDKQFVLYFARHQQAGRGNWCEMSNQKVEK